ncbi:glutamine synthetase [Planosporangium flavigriseum]|uniref:Glutamine synthetase n=1 Tax=Planosporangium flavigriseum TaxID=373681 RepID=A0A8J3PPP7_9ACTN|nr:glutamine synthetase family protein [Planosporangium flavigriseum]NJC67286.1 glutamine synthetase [Planosporangium flavigriseum]GIG75251.1 glutamine synthetase [Planosporangium flavigriseum]
MGPLGPTERGELAARAREIADDLATGAVRAVALTWVDNAGVTRVKTVPRHRLPHIAAWGVGASPVFDVFCVDDSITTSRYIGGPVGDLRLHPDLDRMTVLAAQHGWAWAPVDRWTQEGEPYPACQRMFARRMAVRLADAGVRMRAAFEVEWFVGKTADDPVPATTGPAYGMTRVVELSDYARDLLDALAAQDVAVEQFHPEYASGQLELSVAPGDPVAAADMVVLVRQTIRAVAGHHGLRVSFAPMVAAGQVGNGAHLHFSLWDGERNLFAGGDGPYGMTARGESILAALLDRMPALVCVTAPSVASYLRLVPQRWAGAFQCWGRENREAALRFVTGVTGAHDTAANAELKCCDPAANPYLAVGAVCAVAAHALDAGLKLPAEVTVDPAALPEPERPPRLPDSLPTAIARLERDDLLREAMGEELFEAFLAVRRAEAETFGDREPEEVVAATRWVY